MTTETKSNIEEIKEDFDRILEYLANSTQEDIDHAMHSNVFFSHVVNIDYRNPENIIVEIGMGMENNKDKKIELNSVVAYKGNNKTVAQHVYNNIAKNMKLLRSRIDPDGTPYYEAAFWTWEPDNN